MKAKPPVIPGCYQQPWSAPPRKSVGCALLKFFGWCFLIFVICPIILTALALIGRFSSMNAPTTTPSSIPARGSGERRTTTITPAPKPEPKLMLLDWSWHQEYGFAIVEGQVKNISSESIRSVEAVAQFYTGDEKFITSQSALIEYNPILQNQTSPFRVGTTWNPEMKSAQIDFKQLMGGSIYWTKQK
jgi:hypothetical protein